VSRKKIYRLQKSIASAENGDSDIKPGQNGAGGFPETYEKIEPAGRKVYNITDRIQEYGGTGE